MLTFKIAVYYQHYTGYSNKPNGFENIVLCQLKLVSLNCSRLNEAVKLAYVLKNEGDCRLFHYAMLSFSLFDFAKMFGLKMFSELFHFPTSERLFPIFVLLKNIEYMKTSVKPIIHWMNESSHSRESKGKKSFTTSYLPLLGCHFCN